MMGLQDPVWKTNEKLSEWLLKESGPSVTREAPAGPSTPEQVYVDNATVIVSHVEVNDRHGVGVLLKRLFHDGGNIVSIRSRDLYGGEHHFGRAAVLIAHQAASRPAVFRNVLSSAKGYMARRILCVPYYPDDVWNAIALREIYGAPLATYLMDDQNIATTEIPDHLLRELLEKSSLRLAISPQMVFAYQQKYGCEFAYLPPLAPAAYVLNELNWTSGTVPGGPGIIVGNIWSRRWLDLLRETVRGSGLTLCWHSYSRLGADDRSKLARDGILVSGGPPLPDSELVALLRRSSFAVVPSGIMDGADDRGFIAEFSLPSRIPFIMATSHTPLVVLGNRRTAAAGFVEHLGIGVVCPYEMQAFRETVAQVCRTPDNLAMRRNAFAAGPRYSDQGAAAWIWRSLESGAPVDDTYQRLMPPRTAV